MYPRNKGHPDNHKRDYCSDGAPSTSSGSYIPFPQPEGIFVKGKSFETLPFFWAVQDLYQRAVVEGVAREDLSLEMEVFATMLMNRTKNDIGGDGVVAFCLFKGVALKGAESVSNFVFEAEGKRYLRIGCL